MATPKPDDVPKHVAVVCSTCHARFDARLKGLSHFAKCPDCYKQVRVPSREEVLKQLAERKLLERTEEVGSYRLAGSEQPTGDGPKSVTIICRKCHARLDPELKTEPRRIRCPDCHSPVAVPSLADVQLAEANKPKPRKIKSPKPLPVPAVPKKTRLPLSYLSEQAKFYETPTSPPPRWTFFSSTFTFPWHQSARLRWIYLSLGWTALSLLGLIILWLFRSTAFQSGIAMAFFALPAIWVSLWTVSYGAACFVPVVIDTAAGNDDIPNWPEPVWKEWVAQLIYVGFIFIEANVAGYGIGRLAEQFTNSDWHVALVASFLLFPIFLLSSLEANSVFVPLSLPILRTLVTHAWIWFLFYVLSGTFLFFWVWVFPFALVFATIPTLLTAGPIWAASVLIYARLIGRLAWRSSIVEDEKEAVPIARDSAQLIPQIAQK